MLLMAKVLEVKSDTFLNSGCSWDDPPGTHSSSFWGVQPTQNGTAGRTLTPILKTSPLAYLFLMVLLSSQTQILPKRMKEVVNNAVTDQSGGGIEDNESLGSPGLCSSRRTR